MYVAYVLWHASNAALDAQSHVNHRKRLETPGNVPKRPEAQPGNAGNCHAGRNGRPRERQGAEPACGAETTTGPYMAMALEPPCAASGLKQPCIVK